MSSAIIIKRATSPANRKPGTWWVGLNARWVFICCSECGKVWNPSTHRIDDNGLVAPMDESLENGCPFHSSRPVKLGGFKEAMAKVAK